MVHEVTLPAAVLAGLISFLSPCVLPLVPPYLCFLAGTTLEQLADQGEKVARRDAIIVALFFVLGFSTVFIALGAAAFGFRTLVGPYLYWLGFAAGAFLIVMGLHFLDVFRIGIFYREARLQVSRAPGTLSAYVMGLAFAFGWTPCIGPILVAILALAASETTLWKGAALLAAYSCGLGIPFVLAAWAMAPFVRFMKRFRAHFHAVERAVGACLILLGLGFLSGGMQNASNWLLATFPSLAQLG